MNLETVLRYHDATKHHFDRFARSLGYLDWASQPDPFRRYAGAALIELPRGGRSGSAGPSAPAMLTEQSIGEFLRCSMGLSAWKQYGASRWALRVNPSSGNLHPTEPTSCGMGACVTTRRRSTRSRFEACSASARRCAPAGALPGRADVHSLARGVEVRRARVPLLPARRRPRHRRAAHRGGLRVAAGAAAALVGCADRGAAGTRS